MAGFLTEWCQLAADSGVRQMQQPAKTLMLHARGILNWWEHRISNGRMEGINNKIKARLRRTQASVPIGFAESVFSVQNHTARVTREAP
jgi:hypothetical protein